MRDQAELSISELRQKRGDSNHASQPTGDVPRDTDSESRPSSSREETQEIWAHPRQPATDVGFSGFPPDGGDSDEESFSLPFDPIRLLEALKRKWYLWIGAGLLLLAAGIYYTFGITRSTVSMQLIRRDTPVLFRATENGDSFKPQQFNPQTLVALIKNPEVIQRTSTKAKPPISPSTLSLNLTVVPQPETDLVTLTLKGTGSPQDTVNVLNLYATEFVQFTQEMQSKEAESIVGYLGEKLHKVETELAEVDTQIKKLPPEAKVASPDKLTETYLVQLSELEVKYELARMDLEHNNPVNDKLQAARAELAGLLVRYTEAHPLVQDQRLRIKTLEAELANSGTNAVKFGAATAGRTTEALAAQTQSVEKQAEQLRVLRDQIREKLNGLNEKSLDYALIQSRFHSLQTLRSTLAARQREAELSAENSLGYFEVFTPANVGRVSTKAHLKKGLLISAAAALFGMFFVAGLVLIAEVFDDRIKTANDATRVTSLPLLASVGNLNKMNDAEKSVWAFRTWTILKGKLTASQTKGMVCGFIAAHHGSGCTTWVNLLTKTANQRGLRVLNVATKAVDEPGVHPHESAGKDFEPSSITKLSPTAFSFPAQVSKQLKDPNGHSVVHIPLPGWVWNLERREQWQTALDHWRKIDNLVLLVELPPACEPEAVLLAEKVPQLIWLNDSGRSTVHETRSHLETLRHAGCNLVGTVLNREPESFWHRHIVRRFGIGAAIFALGFAPLQAAEVNSNSSTNQNTVTNAIHSFSVVSPTQRANWQKRLTLGPGDVLTLGFYGETNLTKTAVAIRPDGRISYLQAHDVMAAGLTVDELRDKLNEELGKYFRSPRVLISPVAYNSKKYYVLGNVTVKGAFNLDRPMTILEAVARAQGLQTGILDRHSVDLADLDKSFLVRDGKRVPIDFAKLFEEGDLSQNIPIEPDDYLYFPPAILQEVYVLGEVNAPGVVAYTKDSSVLSALADRGWFNDRAFKSRVLVVRGSLQHPETFVVDTRASVDARAPDFKLQPKDIIYVSQRPFIKAEDLLDIAATSFIQSAVTAWTGGYIGPIITKPFIPHP